MKSISPITFIDKLIRKNELGQPFTLIDHQREVLRLAFAFDQDGSLPWDTILYSCIKKSSNTTLNSALTLAWGFTQEAPNEMLVLANDLTNACPCVQDHGRHYQHNLELQHEAELQTQTIYLANTTTREIGILEYVSIGLLIDTTFFLFIKLQALSIFR